MWRMRAVAAVLVAAAATASCGEAGVTEEAPPLPMPVSILKIDPPEFAVGQSTAVVVEGTGLVAGAVISWDGHELVTGPWPYAPAGRTALQANVGPEQIDHERIIAAKQVEIGVRTPAGATATQVYPVRYTAPSCVLHDPGYVPAGSGDVQLTCQGTGLTAVTGLLVGSTLLPGQLTSPTAARFMVPAALFAGADRVEFTITNPGAAAYPRSLHVLEPVVVARSPGERLGQRCIIDAASALQCWDSVPRAVAPGVRFIRIDRTCAETEDQAIHCWGDNSSGQLGAGYASNDVAPVPPPGVRVQSDRPLHGVAAARAHTCALDTEGYAWCWGFNAGGELGSDAGEVCPLSPWARCATSPVAVMGDLRFLKLSAGTSGTCGITVSGELYCWGAIKPRQSPESEPAAGHVPERAADGLFTDVGIGFFHACALAIDGSVWCWTVNAMSPQSHKTPFRVDGIPPLSRLGRLGEYGGCGITEAGVAFCWEFGSIGRQVPQVAAAWTEVAHYTFFACGFTAAGGFYCWREMGSAMDDPFPLVFRGWPCGYKALERCYDGPTPVLGIEGLAYWR